MRLPAFVALTAFVAASLAVTTTASASSGLTRKLWILNQSGDPAVADFFTCVLGTTNWNDLANTYAAGETLVLGAQVQRNDNPCTGDVGGTDFYQCAANAGHFNLTQYDVLLVIYPNGGYGGQNGAVTLENPVGGASVTINVAHVTTSPDPIYQTIYGGHEVFEAQTDGASADCCDGETATGGPMNWCAQCGDFGGGAGACGKYATGGTIATLGIDTIACPNATYHYQRVSPASHEFDGTCTAITPLTGASDPCGGVSPGSSGVYCGSSTENGFGAGKPGTLYTCKSGFAVSTMACPYGCFIAAAGVNDGCNGAPVADGGADASRHDRDASSHDGHAPSHDADAPSHDADASRHDAGKPEVDAGRGDAESRGVPVDGGAGDAASSGHRASAQEAGASGEGPASKAGESGGCAVSRAGGSDGAWGLALLALVAGAGRRRRWGRLTD